MKESFHDMRARLIREGKLDGGTLRLTADGHRAAVGILALLANERDLRERRLRGGEASQ